METLLIERADGVLTVAMNRPERKNAITPAMLDELDAVFAEFARSDDRVLVLTGAGGAFCSGADLGEGGPTAGGLAYMRRIADVVLRLHRLAKPTIAKVDGVAAGLGCNLALGCDLIVASDRARFSEIFHKRGLSIDGGGTWLLPRLVGLHKAKELAFFADILDAAEAERLGIVNRVVAAGDLDGFVDAWARRLAAGPPLALSMTKTMLNASWSASMADALEDEARCQVVNFATADVVEAMQAFVEKREPRFTGR